MSLKMIDHFDKRRTNIFDVRFVFVHYVLRVKLFTYFCCIKNVKITQVYRNGHDFTTICHKIYALCTKLSVKTN